MSSRRGTGLYGMTSSHRFRAVLELAGRTATGVTVPPEVVEALGGGRQPLVHVTLGEHRYRSKVAVRGGEFKVPVSAENRAAAGVQAGDEVDVELALDTEPRELEVPPDLGAALDAVPAARASFDALSYSRRRWFVLDVDGAKTDATRQRRIEKHVAALGLDQRDDQ
jgi:Bacteriocin-protection, YdeI or OmpD-Associated/Domain of unknown function (DUF1905)